MWADVRHLCAWPKGYWLLAIGYWLMANGYWISYWLLPPADISLDQRNGRIGVVFLTANRFELWTLSNDTH